VVEVVSGDISDRNPDSTPISPHVVATSPHASLPNAIVHEIDVLACLRHKSSCCSCLNSEIDVHVCFPLTEVEF